jgi:hypothetical protein
LFVKQRGTGRSCRVQISSYLYWLWGSSSSLLFSGPRCPRRYFASAWGTACHRFFCPTISKTVSVSQERGPQMDGSRRGCVPARRAGKRDSKCRYRADERAQDGKINVVVRVRECHPCDVDCVERTRSQSLFGGHIRPEQAWNYDPGDEQSDYHLDEQLKERESLLLLHDVSFQPQDGPWEELREQCHPAARIVLSV